MRIICTVLVLCTIHLVTSKSTTTKESNDEHTTRAPIKNTKAKLKKVQPAILAIEIVDENNKSPKNSKRTIDNALGYGYQSQNFGTVSKPRYEVYKYSQMDIIPDKGHEKDYDHSSYKTQENDYYTRSKPVYDVQKSIDYQLPTITQKYQNTQHYQPQHYQQQHDEAQHYQQEEEEQNNNLKEYYQPGITLFSTINKNGQLSSLSNQVPHQGGSHVPVIILRVYANQLDSNHVIQPNLPQSNPYAADLNSVNLQDLLSKYLQAMLSQLHHQYYQPKYEQQEQYSAQQHEPEHQYQPPQPVQYQSQHLKHKPHSLQYQPLQHQALDHHERHQQKHIQYEAPTRDDKYTHYQPKQTYSAPQEANYLTVPPVSSHSHIPFERQQGEHPKTISTVQVKQPGAEYSYGTHANYVSQQYEPSAQSEPQGEEEQQQYYDVQQEQPAQQQEGAQEEPEKEVKYIYVNSDALPEGYQYQLDKIEEVEPQYQHQDATQAYHQQPNAHEYQVIQPQREFAYQTTPLPKQRTKAIGEEDDNPQTTKSKKDTQKVRKHSRPAKRERSRKQRENEEATQTGSQI